MDVSINNVINISVAQAGQGVSEYNTSNIAVYTRETKEASFGSGDYKIYKIPSSVATDFGTAAVTTAVANAIFGQQPNILNNNGYMVVIPFADTPEVEQVAQLIADATPVSGNFRVTYAGNESIDIAFDADASAVQAALQGVLGLENVTVTGTDIVTGFEVTYADVDAPTATTITNNTMQDGGAGAVGVDVNITTPYSAEVLETIQDAFVRTKNLVQFFALFSTEILSETDALALAALIQPEKKMAAVVSRDSADVEPDGKLDLIRQSGYSRTRTFYYGADNDKDAIVMMASYLSRGLSVNFNGVNTTITMHLKDLTGVLPDSTIDETLLAKIKAAGADCYPSIQGVAKVFTSGENEFFDYVHNLLWFVGALEVSGFNLLAQVSTKVAQTEEGVSQLKGVYRKICTQGVINQYIAAGEWNRPADTFGNQEDFYENIRQVGFYIYSSPVASQSATSREDREAPLIQIAIKLAGALHSSNVIINVNK